MTNILDSVEPDLYVCENEVLYPSAYAGMLDVFKPIYKEIYSRETVERLIAQTRKQVLLEAADAVSGEGVYMAAVTLRRMADQEGDEK
jgi:hypothetical protein